MKNVLEWLENSACGYPDKTAVDDGKTALTYSELAGFSRRIGSGVSRFVSPGSPVVVLMEKSTAALAVMLGVVYAGCFYVNVHPEQPPERIRRIFEVLAPEAVIVEEGGEEILGKSGYEGRVLYREALLCERIEEERLNRIREGSRETDLLYGIFTSGSTGVPKGIAVSHKAVLQFIGHFTEIFEISEKERIGNQAPFDFDVSVKDIYSAMKTGGTLILIPREMFAMPPRLLDYLCEKEVTVLIWAVSALCVLSALKGLEYRVPYSVKKVLFSGEVMPVKQLRIWQEALPEATFVNLYGPTEITCNCTYYRIDQMAQEGDKLPVGYPFPGRRVFLLDEERQEITAPGEAGEICVAGESLAEGYYRDEEQTRRRFIRYVPPGAEEERVYCTGDMGYYGKKGELYFAGRKDFQIKHMGHRIELEEIEAALAGVEGVSRCCCVFDREKNRIAAFYQGDTGTKEVRRNLKERLPVYMIPGKLTKVDSIPLNKNGKTDRNYFIQQMGGERK